ncbi:hypothetical protein D3C72_1886450 [compost metagenome]
MQEQIEADRGLALLEHAFTLRNPSRGRVRQELVELLVAHPVEQRKSLDDGPIDLHRR